MSFFDEEFWKWQIAQLPYYICLILSGLLCIVNYQRNPRGAKLFGSACLLMIVDTLLWVFAPFFFNQILLSVDSENWDNFYLGLNFVNAMLAGGAWILAALAVFLPPRRIDVGTFEDGE